MNQGHKLVFGAFHSDKNVNLLWNVVGGKWWSEWARGCTRCYFMQRKTGDFDFARNLIFGNWELSLICTIIFYKHVSYLQQICVCVHMNTSTQLMGPTALRNISTHPNPEKLFIEKSITTIHLFTNPVFPMHMINI